MKVIAHREYTDEEREEIRAALNWIKPPWDETYIWIGKGDEP